MLVLSSEKDKVLIPLVEVKKLAVIDLVSQNVNAIDFNFLGKVGVELYLFKESNLVCILEQTYPITRCEYISVESRTGRVTYLQMANLGKPYY